MRCPTAGCRATTWTARPTLTTSGQPNTRPGANGYCSGAPLAEISNADNGGGANGGRPAVVRHGSDEHDTHQ